MSRGDGSTPDGGADVQGHISDVSGGQVAVGGRVFQIDAATGSYVVINADSEVEVVRRPAPVLRPPPAFPGLVARTAELQRISSALTSASCVEVHGPAGIGKTALLRAASNVPLTPSTPDGVVAIPARLGTADTLSYVFDTCYVGTRRVVPRREELATALADLRLLVVLDDTSLSRDDIDALREALPSSLLLLAGLQQRVFDGVEGIALGGLTVEQGVDVISAGVGRELTERERDVGVRISEVLHGTPLELVRFASLVRADEGDLVSVARGFGVDAQPEDLLFAVQRSVSTEEQVVLAALAAFDAPVGAGPVAAFSGYAHAGALLIHLCARGLVQGDDLQGWRVRDHTAAPPEDRERAATVLTTWVRDRSVPEEVAGEIPAVASALRQARQDRRWIDAIALAAAAERPLALAGRWSAWRDTLKAGQSAALNAGDDTSKRFFDHQLGVLDDAMTEVIPVAHQSVALGDAGHRESSPSDNGTGSAGTDPAPVPHRTSRGRMIAVVGALLVFVAVVVGLAVAHQRNTPNDKQITTAASTTAGSTTAVSTTPPTNTPTRTTPRTTGAPNLRAFTLANEPANLEVNRDSQITVRVHNTPTDTRQVGPSTGGALTVSLEGDPAELIGGTPGCTVDSGALRCELRGLRVDRTTDVTVTLRGRTAGSVVMVTVAQAKNNDPGPTAKRTFTVTPAPCTVPDALGQPVDVAVAAVKAAGFRAEQIPVEDGQASGLVVRQKPESGGQPDCGTTVTLTFSTVT